jgi:cell division protease FtsH
MAALGYTLQRPQNDRYLATRSQLESEIQVLLGGMAAEELRLGENSSGAMNDLERATNTARRMVKNYGMSPRLGPVSFQDSGPVFLPTNGRPAEEHAYSENTARQIDEEIKRILDESLTKVRALLANRQRALCELTDRLLTKEVIDSGELAEVLVQFPEADTSPSVN